MLWRFCDILRNLGPLLVERGTEVQKDHAYQKYFFSLDESKINDVFKDIERWEEYHQKWVLTLFQEVKILSKRLY